MSDKITFRIGTGVVCGAMTGSDGASAFDKAPVVLTTLDAPGGYMRPKEWGDVFVVGKRIEVADWRAMTRSGQSITFPTTPTPFHAQLWVLRANFPMQSIAVGEAHAAGIVSKERRVSGRLGEQVQLLVDGDKGQRVLGMWRDRLRADGVEAAKKGEWRVARQLFLVALTLDVREYDSIFRIVAADNMDGDDGTELRTSAYISMVHRLAEKRGHGERELLAALRNVCRELEIDEKGAKGVEKVMGGVG